MLGNVRCNSISSAVPGFMAALMAAWAAVTLGCTTSVKVEVDENEDFSHYRTWDWMPQIRPRVEGPYSVTPALDLRLQRLIEASLEARGFRRTEPPADFYVTFHLMVERKTELSQTAVAPYVLNSLHSTPSFYIERTESVERRFDDFRLALGITEGGGRMTWQATLEKRVDASEELPLEAAVTKLFDRFPASAPPTRSPEQP